MRTRSDVPVRPRTDRPAGTPAQQAAAHAGAGAPPAVPPAAAHSAPGRSRRAGARPAGSRLVVAVPRDGGSARLPDGERVRVREAGPQDRAAVLGLHGRCSEQTLRLRYQGPVADADRYVTHLLDPRHGRSLAVERGGELVALGHLLWDDEESEIALLVADAWQRRGVGTLLLRRLVGMARELRRPSVYGVTGPAVPVLRTAARALGRTVERHEADGVVVLSAVADGKAVNSGNA